ncbi:MAG TPA: hypothetical protein PLK04_09825 [Bacillota bacterium]|jgi:hypothetical protein|nr:hypothetical protein [Bacillota bacterium]HQD81102.1 hypothetical protein [Bacillota bacterium]
MARMIDADTVHAVIGELARVISSLGIDDRGAFESARRRLDEHAVRAYTAETVQGVANIYVNRMAALAEQNCVRASLTKADEEEARRHMVEGWVRGMRRLAEDLHWWLVLEASMVEALQRRASAQEATSSDSRMQAVPDKEVA